MNKAIQPLKILAFKLGVQKIPMNSFLQCSTSY